MLDLLKRPVAFLPLLISLAFLVPMLVGAAQGTLVRQPDENTAAHLFQIFMPLQLIIVAWFAATWLPKQPRAAAQVLSLQAVGILSVFSIVILKQL